MKNVSLALNKGIDNIHDNIQLGDLPEGQIPRLEIVSAADNIDIDAAGLGRLRGGRVVRLAQTSPHSFWVHPQDKSVAYFVCGSALKKLNVDYSATTVTTLSTNDACRFDVINGEVLVTNGTNIGWLNGTTYAPFSQTLGTFELAMPAGEHVAFLAAEGTLFTANGNMLYRSKPYNCMVRDSRYSEFPMDGSVRMLGAVEDGIWLATDKHVGFIQFDGDNEYRFIFKDSSVPANGCYGTTFVKGTEKPERLVYWAANGFFEGKAGGQLVNRSEPLVRLPAGISGSCFRREHRGWYQYVAVIRQKTAGNIYTEDTMPTYQAVFDIPLSFTVPEVTLTASG
jgi:hypothetical protein